MIVDNLTSDQVYKYTDLGPQEHKNILNKELPLYKE